MMEDSRRCQIKNDTPYEINNNKRIILKNRNDDDEEECFLKQELKKEKEANIQKTIELVNLQDKLKEQNHLFYNTKSELQLLKQQKLNQNSDEIILLKHQTKKLEENNLLLNDLLNKKTTEFEVLSKETKEKYDAQLKKSNLFAAKQCETIKKHRQAVFDDELSKIKEFYSIEITNLKSSHAIEVLKLEEMNSSQYTLINEQKLKIDSNLKLIVSQKDQINELNKKIFSHENQQNETSHNNKYSISTIELNLKIKKFESQFQNKTELIEIKEFQTIINDLDAEIKYMARQQHDHLKKIEDQEKTLQDNMLLLSKQKETIKSLENEYETEIKNLNIKNQALVQEKIQTQLKNYSLNEKIEILEKTSDEYKLKFEKDLEIKESELTKLKQLLIEHCMTLDLTVELEESNGNKILNDVELKEASNNFEVKLKEKINSIQNRQEFLTNINKYTLMQLENLKYLILNLKTGLNQVKIDRDYLQDKLKKDAFKYNSKIRMLIDEIADLQQNRAPRLSKEYDKLNKTLKDEVEKCKQNENEILSLKKIINSNEIEIDRIKNIIYKQNQMHINLMKNYNIKYRQEEFDSNVNEIGVYIESLWHTVKKYTREMKLLNEINVRIDAESQEKSFIIEKLKEQENISKRRFYRNEDDNNNNDRKRLCM